MGVDIVFEIVGFVVIVKQVFYLVMCGGKIMIVGIVFGDLVINFFKINCEVIIQMVFRYVNCYLVMIEVIFLG